MKKFLYLLILLAVVTATAYLFAPVSRVSLAKPSGEVIDMHVHAAGLGYRSDSFLGRSLRESIKFPFYLHAFDVSKELLETHGDQILIARLAQKIRDSKYVDKAVVLALDAKVDSLGELDPKNSELYVSNEYVAAEVSKYPELLFGASVNPYRKDAIKRLEKVAASGAVLIKWIPCIMGIDPADEKLLPFYLKLIELHLPLLSHAGMEKAFSNSEDALCDPLRLELPLQLGVTVIAAHIATTGHSDGQDNFERVLPLFRKYKNLYSEISSLTQINKRGYLVSALQNPDLQGRLLYGSDWPLQMFPVVSPYYHLDVISLGDAKLVNSFANQWDRDLILKRAMGTPDEIFLKSSELLK